MRALSIVRRVENNEYYISNVAVYPEFRGAKLGTNLILKMEEEAKSSGAGKIVLDVDIDNEGAIRLYNRLGYSVVGKPRRVRDNGKDIATVKMCKKL